jgi:hypothetical protein
LLWAQLFANFGSLRHPTFSDTSDTYTTAMVMHQYVAASLGLLSLAAIAGAGVGVGSGVGMMAMAMAEEEAKQVCRGPSSASCALFELLLPCPWPLCHLAA